MKIINNLDLKPYNTFGISVIAKYFVQLNIQSDIQKFLKMSEFHSIPKLVIGEGSNILLTKDFDGIVVKINTKGIEIVREYKDEVLIKVNSGENWDDFVEYCVNNNYSGIENLSKIPGTVGSSPVQNIGAFGCEVQDVIRYLEYTDIVTCKNQTLYFPDCKFGYRDSIFKNALKNKTIITSVTFRLSKVFKPNLSYSGLKNELEKEGITDPDIRQMRETVIKFRNSRVPDPKVIGNAGSFFKNPVIKAKKLLELKKKYPNIVSYKTENEDEMKVAAGWLIEASGWKGKKVGVIGVNDLQALILLNYGDATGQEIMDLAKNIQNTIQEKFGISLEIEVNIV